MKFVEGVLTLVIYYKLKILRVCGVYPMRTSLLISCSLVDIRFEKKSWLRHCTGRKIIDALNRRNVSHFYNNNDDASPSISKSNFAILGPVEWNTLKQTDFSARFFFAVRRNVSGWGELDWRDTKDVIFPTSGPFTDPDLVFPLRLYRNAHYPGSLPVTLLQLPFTPVIVVSKDVGNIFYQGTPKG